MSLSLIISPLRATSVIREGLYLIMLSILLSTALIAALAVPPYLIVTIKVSSKFGALREKFY
jgi:hypothetical protein